MNLSQLQISHSDMTEMNYFKMQFRAVWIIDYTITWHISIEFIRR